MALIESEQLDADNIFPISATAEKLRKRVSKGGLKLDEDGCKLIDELLEVAHEQVVSED